MVVVVEKGATVVVVEEPLSFLKLVIGGWCSLRSGRGGMVTPMGMLTAMVALLPMGRISSMNSRWVIPNH